jgi:tRNA 2-selenouridine synthase
MILPIEPTCFVQEAKKYPVIDVRSPGEFNQGHIPGAFNLPLFTDAERAVVGTLYVKSGREYAVLKGLDYALPKTGWYIDSLQTFSSTQKILLHCWRGGLRSLLMAEVFSKAGYEVALLSGGYKDYRRFIREDLSRPGKIIVLGGFTGTGKTALLKSIASKGEQVVDLEGLACHKGSVFGALGQPAQPTNEQFENNLYSRWSDLDFSKMIWVEDESRMIGKVTLPDPIVEHISSSPLIRVDLDASTRIKRLVMEYAGYDKELLSDAIIRIGERLGGTRTREAITAIENSRFDEVATIALSYYDKAYLFSTVRRKNKTVHDFLISGEDIETDAAHLIEFSYKYIQHGTDLPRL